VTVQEKRPAPGNWCVVKRNECENTQIIGRKADMRTPNDLSRYFRDKVVAEAVVQYAA
jgi:hypothetical protein